MKGKERGNAMLISAILVFGLTVTALGVSRMLIKGMEGAQTQRQFLGLQAHALAEAGILAWTREMATPSNPATYAFKIVKATPGGPVEYGANVRVAHLSVGNSFQLLSSASIAGADGTVVERLIEATISCAAFPCPASASYTKFVGGP